MKKIVLLVSGFILHASCFADFKVEAGQVVTQPKAMQQFDGRSTTNFLFDITRTDGNLRNALTRWGGNVEPKWKVVWQAPRDLQIDGEERFSGDFKTAVRSLLKSTNLTDMELQPCFHTNYVVRIVKKTVRCDSNAN